MANEIQVAKTKQFAHLLVLMDADECCASTPQTNDRKLEPNAVAEKAMHPIEVPSISIP